MVTADTTTELKHFTRSIKVDDGPAVKTKKGRKVSFQIEEVRVTWYEGQQPYFATAHGHYTKRGVVVGASRKYALDGSEPKWLKKLIKNA